MKPIRGFVGANSEFKRFFQHFGVQNARVTPNQIEADCPFPDCQKEGHFFIGPATGKWDCKKCGREGNPLEFVRQFHAEWLARTTPHHYTVLSENRLGISPEVFSACSLAFNGLRNEWLLPSFAENGIVNLFAYRELYNEQTKAMEKRLMAAPSLPSGVYGMQHVGTEGVLFILEGHWDWLAWYGVLWGLGWLNLGGFIAVTGANNFPKSCLHHLHGRDVFVLFDNDDAGRKGNDKLLSSLALEGAVPNSFHTLHWLKGLPNGYDVRDHVKDSPADHGWQEVYDRIMSQCLPVDLAEKLQASFFDKVDDIQSELSRLQKKMTWLCKRLEQLKGPQKCSTPRN